MADNFYPDEDSRPFVNLTPHEIVLVNQNGTISRIPPSGEVARVAMEYRDSDAVPGVAVAEVVMGQVEGLPSPQEGRYYLVSAMVAQAASTRADVLAPDTGPTAIRRDGQVAAVTRLLRYQPVVTVPVEDALELAHYIEFACSGYTMSGKLPHGYDRLKT
jgi:hypothetical protein